MLSWLSGDAQSLMLYWQESSSGIWVFAVQTHKLFTAASAHHKGCCMAWILDACKDALCSPACRRTQAMGPVTPLHSVAGLHSLRGLA